jgi:hypothetical protein
MGKYWIPAHSRANPSRLGRSQTGGHAMRIALIVSIIGSLVSFHLFTSIAGLPASAQRGYAQTDSTGDPFTFVDAEGTERAVITVIEVQDPFGDFAEGYVPTEGTRVVTITVSYENTGPGPFETRPDHIVLRDTDGYLWSPASVQRSEDIEVPDLGYVQTAPGDRLSGMVAFQLPSESEIASVLLTPESSRLLLLADLDPNPEPAPEPGTATTYQVPEVGSEGVVSVTEIEDPFDDFPEGGDPEDGARYVVVTITIENTGSVPLSVQPGNVLIYDGDGYLWSYASAPRGDDVAIPDLQSQELAPGSRISGVVGFLIPEDSDVSAIILQPESGRIIMIAQLQPTENDGDATPIPKLGVVGRQ